MTTPIRIPPTGGMRSHLRRLPCPLGAFGVEVLWVCTLPGDGVAGTGTNPLAAWRNWRHSLTRLGAPALFARMRRYGGIPRAR